MNEITEKIIGCAVKVHKALAPGFLEITYEVCLVHELSKPGLNVQSQLPLPIVYDGIRLDAGYRIDLLVEDMVIVELKAVDSIHPIHEAQVISYLKLSGKKIGLLINLIKREIVNKWQTKTGKLNSVFSVFSVVKIALNIILIDEAPRPVVEPLDRFHHRMFGFVKVGSSMSVLRSVAAPDVSARQA